VTINQVEEIGHWAGNNLLLLMTIALVLLCAAIDYKALPLLVVKYVKPSGGNLSQILMLGKVTIALLVGIYTWLALVFNAYDLPVAALVLVIWLLVDASFSLWTLFRKVR
jgi:hypothetical protein